MRWVYEHQPGRDKVHDMSEGRRLRKAKARRADVRVPPVCGEVVHGWEGIAPEGQRRLVSDRGNGGNDVSQVLLLEAVGHLPDEPGQLTQRAWRIARYFSDRQRLYSRRLRRGRQGDTHSVVLNSSWNRRAVATLSHVDRFAPDGRR